MIILPYFGEENLCLKNEYIFQSLILYMSTTINNLFFTKFQQMLVKLNFFTLPKKQQKIAVAVSGGSDSMALVVLLQNFCLHFAINLSAVIINHNYREKSESEAKKVSMQLQKLNIENIVLSIDNNLVPTSNIEKKLRQYRYELLLNYCCKKQINYLATGHQLDDVAENFLIRLFRGSGLDGLSTMEKISNYQNLILLRPLLDFSKQQLQQFLQSKNIEWQEDESNVDTKFLRNKIRIFLHSFTDYLPIVNRINKTSQEIANINKKFNCELLQYSQECLLWQQDYCLLKKSSIEIIEKEMMLKMLALMLMEIGNKDYKPRKEKLQNYYQYLVSNAQNHLVYKFYNTLTSDYDHDFFIVKPLKLTNKKYDRTILRNMVSFSKTETIL
jgi:tRNA(Ile)-lysidine synthase